MRLAYLLTLSSALLGSCFLHGQSTQERCATVEQSTSPYYLKLAAGASFSKKMHVRATESFWDKCVEGYNDRLSTAPIMGVGLGYDICPLFRTELMLSHRHGYKYKKFQHGINTNNTPNFLGNKTRRFSLDACSAMLNFLVKGSGIEGYSWKVGHNGSYIHPVVGLGLGVTRFTIRDFYSTGLPPADNQNVKAYGSANTSKTRVKFSYQAQAGLEYVSTARWSVSTGYRWFSSNKFKGPSYVRSQTGVAYDIRGKEWKQRLQTHEIYVEWAMRF